MTTRDGLPNDVIYRLIEDNNGSIWGSTNKGLFRLDRYSTVTRFTYASGLLGDQFNYKSGFRANDGKLYFGGIRGFVAFSPGDMKPGQTVPPVVINSFQVYNTEVQVGSAGNPAKKSNNTYRLHKNPARHIHFQSGIRCPELRSAGREFLRLQARRLG